MLDNKHEQILCELRLGKYYISYLETKLNIPRNTLFEAIAGNRKIPTKYLESLIKELKL
jgi:hypothetical protein